MRWEPARRESAGRKQAGAEPALAEKGDGRMTEEEAYRSPVFREQQNQEELAGVCGEILKNARNELHLSMRFLDVSLSSLYFAADPYADGMETDGTLLFYQPSALAGWYRRNRIYVNRIYLHVVFHCLFCHLWTRKKRAEDYWNLACDIAVESIIDGITRPCVHIPMTPLRRTFYSRLREQIAVLNAESIYEALQKMNLKEGEYERLAREFYRDSHSRWEDQKKPPRPNENRNRKEDWDNNREKMQTEMEIFSKEASEDEKNLLEQIAVENRERYDYREFLRKFSVLKETVQVDPDAFDYVFYHYGMELYGNMPLIEPLETKESKRIEEFVIVIDTSMSCSGELVRKFLEETYSVLAQSESFFKKVNIHILQCDDAVRQDVKIENEGQLKAYMEHLELHGMGGTDFRPAFAYVEQMIRSGKFEKLKGMIYFTDGYGAFPVKMPPYDTAFVFMKENYTDVDVPPWAIKIILDEEQLYRREPVL